MRLDLPTLSVSLSNSVLYLIMKAGLIGDGLSLI